MEQMKPPTIEELWSVHDPGMLSEANRDFQLAFKESVQDFVFAEVITWAEGVDKEETPMYGIASACSLFVLGIEIGMRIAYARLQCGTTKPTK